jgi:BirA family transcriptional regulator, biotin operon repressor / biotin---[acetyl-CoA-carboxylase] ligase
VLPGLSAPACLAQVVQPLVQALLAFEAQGFAPLQAGYAKRDALQGLRVHTSDGQHGQAQGVSARGALRLLTQAGLTEVQSAEVSVRPDPSFSASSSKPPPFF